MSIFGYLGLDSQGSGYWTGQSTMKWACVSFYNYLWDMLQWVLFYFSHIHDMQFFKLTMFPVSFCLSLCLPSNWNALISSLCFKSFFVYILWVSSGKSLSNFLCSCLLILGMEIIMHHHIRFLQLLTMTSHKCVRVFKVLLNTWD